MLVLDNLFVDLEQSARGEDLGYELRDTLDLDVLYVEWPAYLFRLLSISKDHLADQLLAVNVEVEMSWPFEHIVKKIVEDVDQGVILLELEH